MFVENVIQIQVVDMIESDPFQVRVTRMIGCFISGKAFKFSFIIASMDAWNN